MCCVYVGKSYSCESFRLDPLKLRMHPECDFVTGPNFGRVSDLATVDDAEMLFVSVYVCI
jgi:hypothetical protein